MVGLLYGLCVIFLVRCGIGWFVVGVVFVCIDVVVMVVVVVVYG